MNEREKCKNCFTCQTDISPDKTREDVSRDRADKCKNCFSCQTDVSPEITVDNKGERGTQVISMGESRKSKCKNCFTCQTDVSPEITADTVKKKEMPFTWYRWDGQDETIYRRSALFSKK